MYWILYILFLISLLIPISVSAQNYTFENGNQTINITVSPNNTIIVNTTKFEELIKELTEKEPPQWTQGDVLVGSATIVGLFSISSFITTRFNVETRSISISLLGFVVIMSGLIITVHLITMLYIVLGFFDEGNYLTTITATIIAFWFNIYLINKINKIENRGRKRTPRTDLDREFADLFRAEPKK